MKIEENLRDLIIVMSVTTLFAIFGMVIIYNKQVYRTVPTQSTISMTTITIKVPTNTPTPFYPPSQPMGGGFKSYEHMDRITDRTSKQWHLKQLYWIDNEGFCRFNEYYAVAMGTVHAKRIGQMFTIYLEGRTFKAIVGDFKDNRHVTNGVCNTNGSIVEFIVKTMDGDKLQKLFPGQVLKIEEEQQ